MDEFEKCLSIANYGDDKIVVYKPTTGHTRFSLNINNGMGAVCVLNVENEHEPSDECTESVESWGKVIPHIAIQLDTPKQAFVWERVFHELGVKMTERTGR